MSSPGMGDPHLGLLGWLGAGQHKEELIYGAQGHRNPRDDLCALEPWGQGQTWGKLQLR